MFPSHIFGLFRLFIGGFPAYPQLRPRRAIRKFEVGEPCPSPLEKLGGGTFDPSFEFGQEGFLFEA